MTALAVVSLLALGFVWAGYPVAIFVLSRLRRASQSAADPSGETVSIILATRDGADAVRARVTNLLESVYAPERLEIIIGLDAGSAGASAGELSNIDKRVSVVLGDAPGGKAATLNAAVRAARHDVLVFADTAQTFAPDAVLELVRQLADQRVGAVSGMLDMANGSQATLAGRYWRYERWLRKVEARFYACVGVTGAIYAMRRTLWTPLSTGLILDDLYVPMRLVLDGWRIEFTDRARATDARRFAPAQEYHRKVRTLTGVIQLCAWMPAVLNPMRNPIWVQFVCHKLLRLLTPYLVALALIGTVWSAGEVIVARGWGASLGIALATAAATMLIPPIRRALASHIRWGLALQSSIVVATVNGLRGRWDVWRA